MIFWSLTFSLKTVLIVDFHFARSPYSVKVPRSHSVKWRDGPVIFLIGISVKPKNSA